MENAVRRYNTHVLAVLVFVGAVLWYRFDGLVLGAGERIYAAVTYPFLWMQHRMAEPFIDGYRRYVERVTYGDELELVKAENSNLRARIIELDAALQLSADIQELVAYRKQFDELQGTIVGIIGLTMNDREHSILVDRGSRHGIRTDMVATYKNCLLGRVSEVYDWYSKITLITDKTCKVAACCTTTKACGIHVGSNEAHTDLQRVNHLEDVQHNDLVVSSGEGAVFPQGFALGCISEVGQNGLYKIIRVVPAVDIATIRYCTLVQKGFAQAQACGLSQRPHGCTAEQQG